MDDIDDIDECGILLKTFKWEYFISYFLIYLYLICNYLNSFMLEKFSIYDLFEKEQVFFFLHQKSLSIYLYCFITYNLSNLFYRMNYLYKRMFKKEFNFFKKII